jgi:TetR/AcrR family transcriptional repressor of nem operon
MKVSREQVAENRQKILDAASRLFRERGYDSVTVSEVMGAAGLTHGGFYGHFASKEELIAEALAMTFARDTRAELDAVAFAEQYLSRDHRDDRATGCAVAALGGETVRQSPEARAAMTDSLRRTLDRFTAGGPASASPAERRQAAIGNWAAMVGAVMLSRLCDDPALSDEILEQTRAYVAAGAGRLADADGARRARKRA